jgi:ArsR family transcriptional regulator, arsenate/arsenite/antimonite-responsive transcriptional repressor
MNDVVQILKAIADETRFHILNLLLSNDFCVGALSNRLDISKAAVSQHLQVLRKAGLVRGEKRGYWTHYTVQRSLLHEVAGALIEAANSTICVEAICTRASFQNTTITERREINMCKDCCGHPEKLKEKPEECTPEQIKECHGDTIDHPCKGEDK